MTSREEERPKINMDTAENLIINLEMEINTHGTLSEESDKERRAMIAHLEQLQREMPSIANDIAPVINRLNDIKPIQKAA